MELSENRKFIIEHQEQLQSILAVTNPLTNAEGITLLIVALTLYTRMRVPHGDPARLVGIFCNYVSSDWHYVVDDYSEAESLKGVG